MWLYDCFSVRTDCPVKGGVLAALMMATHMTVAWAEPMPFRNPNRSGLGCPSGYVSSGSYCRPSGRDAHDAIPRRQGETCPTGYVVSGNACVRS